MDWLKNRSEKFEELMKADLFVLISYNENFANSVIESLYMGTPVLVSEKVGLAHFIKKENVGWITSLNTKDVAEKLKMICNQPEELQRIQKNSRSIIERVFSEKNLISQYVEQYKLVFSS